MVSLRTVFRKNVGIVPRMRSQWFSTVSRSAKNSKNQPEVVLNSNPGNRAEREQLRQLQRIEVIKGLFQGTGFLVLLFGGFILYNDNGYYKTKLKNLIYGSSLDSDMQNEEKSGKTAQKPSEYVKFRTLKDSSSIPGVYLWGSNADGIVDPNNLQVKKYKLPTRLSFFDGIVLKDLKLNIKLEETKDDLNMYLTQETSTQGPIDQNNFSSGFAIDSNGDLIQWGKGYNIEDPTPKYTLKGFKFERGEFSNNMIYLMNNKNEIMYLPVSANYQKSEPKGSWLKPSVSYVHKLDTFNVFTHGEKIVDFKTGVCHLVLLSNKSKAYIAATGLKGVFENRKNFGQFGLIEYSQFESAPEPNKLHELFLLNNEIIVKENHTLSTQKRAGQTKVIPREIKQIATGNYHTIARDSIGNIYTFGKNTYGQLGFQVSYTTENVPVPKKVDYFQSYFSRSNYYPIVTDIQANSHGTFVTLITKNIQEVFQKNYLKKGEHTTDDETGGKYYFAFGKGLYGQLGINYYVHANAVPKKMESLQNLSEFDESSNRMQDISVSNWAIGKNHCFVTLLNNDVLSFGSNKFGQLGNGKLINSSIPSNILKIVEEKDVLSDKALASAAANPNNTYIKQSDVEQDAKWLNSTKFSKKLNNRLQLISNTYFKYTDNNGKTQSKKLNQIIVAGNDTSAIYYTAA